MPSWGNNDNAANAPYWAVSSAIMNSVAVETSAAAPTAANVALLYGNTQFQAYTADQTIGLFLVDSTETTAGGDNVTDISLINYGSGYVEAPGVQIASGGGAYDASATASISGGKVSNIAIANTGVGYTSDPVVTITQPVLTITTAKVITANDTIIYTAHGQANAAALVYNWGGSSNIGGLLNGSTYYASPLDANRFQLSTTAANAANGVVIDLTTTGQSTQYFNIVAGVRATAVSSRGLSQGQSGAEHTTHVGWNLKTVGAGGRAGRVQFETLVTLANPIGDGADDLSLPDA
jgi:hypothetical protein